MANPMRFAHAVLATTILFGVGCTSEVEELATDDLDLQIASEAEIASEADLKDLSQESEPSLIGCSDAKIAYFQDRCRNKWCGSRDSYGIHYCAHYPVPARVLHGGSFRAGVGM